MTDSLLLWITVTCLAGYNVLVRLELDHAEKRINKLEANLESKS